MLETINTICLWITDPVLGWLLRVPPTVALFIIAIGTSAILTFVRLFTTDQEYLGRCNADKKRLKQLMKQAKEVKDKEALKRYRATMGSVSMKLMAAEGKPLLVSVIPIALLAVWCFTRLAFLPPKADEPVAVKAYFKVSTIGDITHVLPTEGLETAEMPLRDVVVDAEVAEEATVGGGWIQRIFDDPDTAGGTAHAGLAVWSFKGTGEPRTYALTIRHDGRTYERQLILGDRHYAPDLEFYGEDAPLTCTQIVMDEVKLFGVVPGIPWIMFPPWLVAYLLIAIPFVFALKALFKIH